MAAKKAATKSRSSKSRSSKSNKNNNNLKWWYVLPVIAIVAVAGYAIVRFSEAGAGSIYTVRANGISGPGDTIRKSDGLTYKVIPKNQTVFIDVSGNEWGKSNRACATIKVTNNGVARLRVKELKARAGFPITSENRLARSGTFCVNKNQRAQFGNFQTPVRIELASIGNDGAVSVEKIYTRK